MHSNDFPDVHMSSQFFTSAGVVPSVRGPGLPWEKVDETCFT